MAKRILQVILGVLIIVLLGGGIIYFSSVKTTKDERIFTSEEISKLQEISIDGNFDINVTTSESEEVKCSCTKTKRGFQSYDSGLDSKIENNVLYIVKSYKEEPGFILGGETLKVNIDIPKSYKNKLSLKSELGKINILDSNSENIDCKTTDGNAEISLEKICGNIIVDTHLGNIDLKLPKDEKFNLSANSRLGKVNKNFDANVDSSISEKNINLSSSDGNITISEK